MLKSNNDQLILFLTFNLFRRILQLQGFDRYFLQCLFKRNLLHYCVKRKAIQFFHQLNNIRIGSLKYYDKLFDITCVFREEKTSRHIDISILS